MAKKNNIEKTAENNKKSNTVESTAPAKTASVSKKETESHGGLVAAIVAFVALVVIGGGVLAFVFLVKAKNKYINPIIKQKPGTEEGYNIGTTGPSTSEEGELLPEVPITPAPTTPVPPIVLPTAPDSSAPIPPADEDADEDQDRDRSENEEVDEDQPVAVTYYNFDAQLSRMDIDMAGINPDKLDSGEISNTKVGL